MPTYVIGAEQIINNLNRARITWLGKIADDVEKTCNEAENHAKAGHIENTAHMNDRYANQTSNLTNSISSGINKVGINGVTGFIAANQEYAAMVEFGTSQNQAYPFLFPALVHVQPILRARLEFTLRGL